MIKQFSSGFKEKMWAYCSWRKSLGFSDDHEKHLLRFDAYCGEFHPYASSLTSPLVTGWIQYEAKSNRHCIENKCAAIRSFAKYLGGGAYVLKEKYIRYKRNFNPYIFTDEELTKLFAAADAVEKCGDPFFAETAGFIFRLIYTCGLRPQEARKLRCTDINFQTGEIIISQSKQNKDRIIVAAPDVTEMLYRYQNRRSIFCHNNDIFFIHTNGTPITSEQLTDLFQKCWKEANPSLDSKLLPRVRPYDLRHQFASAVLQKWIDEGKIYMLCSHTFELTWGTKNLEILCITYTSCQNTFYPQITLIGNKLSRLAWRTVYGKHEHSFFLYSRLPPHCLAKRTKM